LRDHIKGDVTRAVARATKNRSSLAAQDEDFGSGFGGTAKCAILDRESKRKQKYVHKTGKVHRARGKQGNPA